MGDFSAFLATLNGYIWHEYVLFAIVGLLIVCSFVFQWRPFQFYAQ